ncbi:MAG: tRNA (guanosine(46)-N7)-methyltransferase TrmB [Verrucomicrobia bacterium]|nr:tRNA (guanosine(46)-N7)-methyltransferase TrmB [Verrucomicrobiota bacterium]
MTEKYATLLAARRKELQSALAGIFCPARDFVCEIGCGHGHFLTAFAEKHPDALCVGVDLVEERLARAGRKRDRAGLTNLHFLRAEASFFLESLPPGARIAALFILFPDPWPKLRHHKHRILRADFLNAVAAHASAGCRLHFRTDYRPYFDDARTVIANHPRWQWVDAPWPFECETVFQQRVGSFSSFIAEHRSEGEA